jgi:hypothetical protein
LLDDVDGLRGICKISGGENRRRSLTVECVLLADGMIGGQLVRVITLFFWSKKLIGKERSRLPRDTPFR